jgi:hypothetical protein
MLLVMTTVAAADALTAHGAQWRLVDGVRVGAVLFLALVLALRATTSFSLLPRNPALDDELTRANRASASAWGFWALFGALIVAFAASFFARLQVVEVAPAVVVCGAAVAGLRFVWLERQGE